MGIVLIVIGVVVLIVGIVIACWRADASERIRWAPFIWMAMCIPLVLPGATIEIKNSYYGQYEGLQAAGQKIVIMEERQEVLTEQLVPLVEEYVGPEAGLIEALQERDISELWALLENYPRLRASENFIKLMDELVGLQDQVVTAEVEFNDLAKKYNSWTKQIPTRWFVPGSLPRVIEYK